MKYLDVFILKNFSIERAKEFAEAIFNTSRDYAFLKRYNSIVVKINKKYIKICSELTENDQDALSNARSKEDIDINSLEITSAYYYIALCGLYILNCEDDNRRFKLEDNEQIIWEDNESKLRKTDEMGDFEKRVKLMSLMEGMENDNDLADDYDSDFLIPLMCNPQMLIQTAIAKALEEPRVEVSKEEFIKVVGEKIHMF